MSDEDSTILAEEIIDFCNGLEALTVKLRLQIEKMLGVAKVKSKPFLSEETFKVLKWQAEKGNRLGDYEVAYKNQNILDDWQHCFNILKQSNAVISSPLRFEGCQFRYWIFPKYCDRIFRKKLAEEVTR